MAAAAAYVVVWVFVELFVVVVPLVLALFIAAALHPVIDRLRDWGLPSGLAAALVLVVILGTLTLAVLWLSGRVQGQFADLGQQVDQGVDQVRQWLTSGPLDLSRERVTQLESQLTSIAGSDSGTLSRLMGRARQLIEFLGGAALMLFAAFFLLKDGRQIHAWLRGRFTEPYQDDITAITSRVGAIMRWYLIGTSGVALADAVLLAIVLIVLDVPLVFALALLTFAGAFFPVIGAFVAGAVSALVALVAGGFQTALLVVIATIIVQQVEGNVLQPLIMGRAVRLHPLVTVSVVTAGLVVAGLVGAFLAVPLTAIVAQVGHFYLERDEAPVTAEATAA